MRYRIERGLERLRTLLARRGVALCSLALTAALASEAQAAVPTNVMVHLYDLKSAGKGLGSTANPSVRIQHWSRQRSSTMTRIVFTSASLLLVGGAIWQFLPSAESGVAPKPAPSPIIASTWKASGNPLLDLDPEHARSWIVLRANNGERTARQLRAQPEMVLLPGDKKSWLDDLESMREASFIIDIDALSTITERTRNYRLQQEMTALPPAERYERALAEARRKVDEKNVIKLDVKPHEAKLAVTHPGFPNGWIAGYSPESKLLDHLRHIINDNLDPITDKSVGPDAWVGASAGGTGNITIVGDRISFTPLPGAVAPPTMITIQAQTVSVPNSALEFSAFLDLGRPGLAPIRTATGNFGIDQDGLHFSSTMELGTEEPTGPGLDRTCFARVPTEAFLAIGTAIHPQKGGSIGLYRKLFTSMRIMTEAANGGKLPAEVEAYMNAAGLLLDKTDGVLLAWVEPGMTMPSLTLEVDLAKADADAVIAASGLTRAADGSASMVAGPFLITLGWHNGHFVATSHPSGIKSFEHAGGFTNHPEIQRDLAAMPTGNLNACALIRPVAYLDLATPFITMASPDLKAPLSDYRSALTKGPGYGFLTSVTKGKTTTFEARGVLALACCVLLASQAQTPGFPLGMAN